MAWNEPGNRGGSPWGKKRPAGDSGGPGQILGNWGRQLRAALGSGPPADGAGGSAGNFAWIIVALLLLLWALSGCYQVDAAERGVVQRFGRLSGVRQPGWGMTFPWPIDKLTKVNVQQLNSREYRLGVLTADLNIVEMGIAVQYQKSDPVKVLFQVKDLEQMLAQASESSIREVVGQARLDDVLGAGRLPLSAAIRERVQRALDAVDSGVRVTKVNLTEARVPDPVEAAQRDANKAGEDRTRAAAVAQADADDQLPRAQGQAQHLVQDAEADKARAVALAQGEAARFSSVYAAYAQAPEVTRERMYLETIEKILGDSRKIILDTRAGAGGNMIYLPLDKLLEHSAASARAPAAGAPAAAPASGSATPPATSPAQEELPAVTVNGRDRGVR